MSETNSEDSAGAEASKHFIEEIIAADNDSGRFDGKVHTRFPPEPNGYLHIGHAKSICLNFGMAEKFAGGQCNLRFDDTNPEKENEEFVRSIEEDVRWLGFDWEDRLFFASDYFDRLYAYAVQLVKSGDAYVDSLSLEEFREYKGNWNKPGKNSPHRDRSVEENLDLLERMKAGEFEEGAHTLRAKIDMTAPNMNLRDPTMYRIKKATHHRTGDQWCIYPMYDFTHGQSDSLEGITHSLCTLEFENNRPLYDWFLERLGIHHPQQIEFARLNISYTVLSKRKLLQLVNEGHVSGWDDPRMPTLCGMRRRGYTPASLRNFCARIGVARFNSTIDMAWLEDSLRADLNKRANRVMGVLRPVKLVIENYPEGQTEQLDAVNNPEDDSAGTRKVPFSRELYIEQTDFREEAPRKFFRMVPGREVRLRWAYIVKCTGFEKDEETGAITEIRCTYDPETLGGQPADGRKVKGTIHWVSAADAVTADVRLYDHLFQKPDPDKVEEGESFLQNLNPNSLEILHGCKLEPGLANIEPGHQVQFERQGYFCLDAVESTPAKPVFHRAVTLRDSWAKLEKKLKG